MAKKKKQKGSSNRQQARQRQALKRKQKKKSLQQQRPAAGSKLPPNYDPAADGDLLESLSPEMQAQIKKIEAATLRHATASKRPPSTDSDAGSSVTEPSAEQPKAPGESSDAPASGPLPHGLFSYEGLFKTGQFKSRRVFKFILRLTSILEEIGHEGKPFGIKDIKNPADKIYFRNLLLRKKKNIPIPEWQRSLLDQVRFDWQDSSKPKNTAKTLTKGPLKGVKRRVEFQIPNSSKKTVIFLDTWEEKLQRFEALQQSGELIDSKRLRQEGLINWITETRKAVDAEALPELLVERLKAAKFVFKTYQKREPEDQEARFKGYIEQLKVAQKRFGAKHITHKMDLSIHRWVNKQRWYHREGRLSSWQVAELKKLGVLEKPKQQDLRDQMWRRKFADVQSLLQSMPKSQKQPLKSLPRMHRQWVWRQLQDKKAGKLSSERLRLLNKLPDWD